MSTRVEEEKIIKWHSPARQPQNTWGENKTGGFLASVILWIIVFIGQCLMLFHPNLHIFKSLLLLWQTWLGSTGWGDLAGGAGAHVGPGAETVSTWTPADRCKGEKGAEWSNIKACAVRWKTGQCLLYGARIWPAHERKFMLRVCCLSACLLQGLNFKPHAEFWSSIFQNSNRPQSKYGHILLLTLIMVKLQEPTLKYLPAIFFTVVAINVHQCVFGVGCFCAVILFPTDCCWHGLLPPAPIR